MQMRRQHSAVCVVWLAYVVATSAWAQNNSPLPSDAPVVSGFQAKNSTSPPLQLQKEAPTSALRTTSYVLLGASAATFLTGTVFALLADNNYRSYKRHYSVDDSARVLLSGVDPAAAQKLKDKIKTQKTIAILSLSVAGASAIAGSTLFFLSPEWRTTNLNVGLAPTQGGALLCLQGKLP